MSVEYDIFTSCRLTEKWRVRIFLDVNFFVKYALFLFSTSIRADIAVQGPLVLITYGENILVLPNHRHDNLEQTGREDDDTIKRMWFFEIN